MDQSALIPTLAIGTFVVAMAGFAFTYFRTKRIQKRKDEI